MRTPTGIECPYFYGDYHRGKNIEECRLIGHKPPPQNWKPDLCSSCPVPGIRRANACTHMELEPKIARQWIIGKRQVTITAFCTKSQSIVDTPQVGCGLCHSLDELFTDQ